MAGIKIINVLKDDTFEEILTMFRGTDAQEVIFVLPKKSKVFKREDHFAAFASEAKTAGKVVSILCTNPDINTWARRYAFQVMSAKPMASSRIDTTKVEKVSATLATGLGTYDDDVRDESWDAFEPKENKVVVPSDETMGPKPESDEDLDPLAGMHEVDLEKEADQEAADTDTQHDEEPSIEEEAETVVAPGGGITASLIAAPVRRIDSVASIGTANLKVPKAVEKRADVPVRAPETDYIDAVWRDRAVRRAEASPAVARTSHFAFVKRWFLRKPSPPRTLLGSPMGKRIPRMLIWSIAGASLVLLGVVIYATTGSASITVRPTSTPLDFSLTVKASDVFAAVDTTFKQIPGQRFEITKSVTKEFPASGQTSVASKARGTITISNALGSSQTLVATTRFETTEPDLSKRLIFRTLQTVTVPAAGKVNVQVIADQPGSQYNLAPMQFRIIAFREKSDPDRYEKITGSSDTAFAGGANGPAKLVTQDDYDGAVSDVSAQLKQEISTAFNSQAAGLELINGDTAAVSGVDSSVHPDTVADTFTVTASGSLTTVGFRKSDVLLLIGRYVDKEFGKTVRPDKLDLSYRDVVIQGDGRTMAFTVHVVGTGYSPVDTQKIITDISGKNEQQIRDYFRSAEGLGPVSVVLSPFWVKSVPRSPERVKVQVLYEP